MKVIVMIVLLIVLVSTATQDIVEDATGKLHWQQPEFKDAMVALMMSPAEYDAQTLRESMKRPGINEAKLDEILITRNKKV